MTRTNGLFSVSVLVTMSTSTYSDTIPLETVVNIKLISISAHNKIEEKNMSPFRFLRIPLLQNHRFNRSMKEMLTTAGQDHLILNCTHYKPSVLRTYSETKQQSCYFDSLWHKFAIIGDYNTSFS